MFYDKSKKERLTLYIHPDVKRQAKAKAAMVDLPLQTVVESLLILWAGDDAQIDDEMVRKVASS